ncbi:MAG TPA: YdeI/OmpD-associated family protein [Actinomycetota bacterium]|nr:YdeI/OmpD-associated family protein [Actinomycetota bacterium]
MKPRFFRSSNEMRLWLEKNHGTSSELWVGFYKKGSGKTGLTYSEAVDEALCFGWIDGLTRSIDESRWMIRFSPRKAKSNWSAVNIKRFAELRSQGRVAPSGLEAFERRSRQERKYSYESPPKQLDPGYERRFKADQRAWAFWEAAPPSYRKAAMYWVMSAVKEETRNRRLGVLIEHSRNRERVPPLTSPTKQTKQHSA